MGTKKELVNKIGNTMHWRCHTPHLLERYMENHGAAVLHNPTKIFMSLLREVAERAAELGDPELLSLMCRLTLFDEADPESRHYDEEKTQNLFNQVSEIKSKKK